MWNLFEEIQQNQICPETYQRWLNLKVYFHFDLTLKKMGEITTKGPYEMIVSSKIPTKLFPGFLPQNLKSGQIKKIKALYYVKQPLIINQRLFNTIKIYFYFSDGTNFQILEQKFLGWFLEKL